VTPPSRASPETFRTAFAAPLVRLGIELDALRGRWQPGDARPVQFYRSFAQVRRPLGPLAREPLSPTDAELASLASIYPGFDARTWSVATLARAWLLLQVPEPQMDPWIHQLLRHAEVGEQVAVYRSLWALPQAPRFAAQVAEGVRTNMVDVFDAVALDNPIARWLLDEPGWLQLVLKAVFMARPLHRIVGLDERWTESLASSALDYAQERWSAGRSVHPELWRVVAPSRDPAAQQALQRARADPDPETARAASWALGERAPALWPEGGLPVDEAAGWLRIGREAEARRDAAATRDVLYPSPLPDAPK